MNTAVYHPPRIVKGQQDPATLHVRGTTDLRAPRLAFSGPLGKQLKPKPAKIAAVVPVKPIKTKASVVTLRKQPAVSLKALIKPMRTL